MTENQISKFVLEAAIKVHRRLGPGLLEKAYEACLEYELQQSGLKVERQKAMDLTYENIQMDAGYRLDLLIEEKVIVEIKSVQEMNPVFDAQVLTYLKLSGCKLGLLINFNVPRVVQGFKRIVLNL
ncbi:MAG: GxxExxY protein [Bacteroidota bacterium]